MSLEDDAVLGIALGSSEAAGYVNNQGAITGWLNELAFAPVDYNPAAAVDEWSGDAGVGALYFSQQCVFRLASKVGIALPADGPRPRAQTRPRLPGGRARRCGADLAEHRRLSGLRRGPLRRFLRPEARADPGPRRPPDGAVR